MSTNRRPSDSLSPSPTNHHSSNPNSTTSHRSPPHSSMNNDDDDTSTATPPPPPPLKTHKPTFPTREDCWSEEATRTIIDAWGHLYLQLNRGNLRQKHWQEVANAVNVRHGHIKKARRTDIQCKNRIDTLKKRYKIEKSKSLQAKGSFVSQWPFFSRLDSLIGSSFKTSPAALTPTPLRRLPPNRPLPLLPHPSSVPVGRRSKRPAPAAEKIDDSFFRRNFSKIAAATAAVEAEESSDAGGRWDVPAPLSAQAACCRELAKAIVRFGEIYERVEEGKQRQMIELEKQRMEFAKDLEIQRMKLFMESQIRIQKIKRAKPSSDSDGYL